MEDDEDPVVLDKLERLQANMLNEHKSWCDPRKHRNARAPKRAVVTPVVARGAAVEPWVQRRDVDIPSNISPFIMSQLHEYAPEPVRLHHFAARAQLRARQHRILDATAPRPTIARHQPRRVVPPPVPGRFFGMRQRAVRAERVAVQRQAWNQIRR